ncbi:MAG: hypothetical protein K2J67_00480 [Lachnospiraceae bacterium]|nr:hypothetical protein [Lachnospiraceae bacterium]
MESINQITLYGSDKRQLMLGKLFEEAGIPVNYLDESGKIPEIAGCQLSTSGTTVLLPLPCPDTLLDTILSCVEPDYRILGGNLPVSFVEKCTRSGAKVYDYLKSPSVVIHNTVATAEGAVCEAITHSPWNLHGSNCLVMGYGRCGSVLADRLAGMGCHVTISARDIVKIAQAETYGYEILRAETELSRFRFLFNTIPAPVIGKSFLQRLSPEVTIIDIASAPGGCDFDYCRKHEISAHLCLGLPAKYAPKSSAEIIFRHIQEIFQLQSKGKMP